MSKIEAAAKFITECERAYNGVLTPQNDLKSWDNTVPVYTNPDNQKKYIHMYFAKYVGCWRAIRKRILVPETHNLVSIGAGPLLCVAGWHWDSPTLVNGGSVRAYDVLDWAGTVNLPEFGQLWNQLFTSWPHRLVPRYMPDKVRPQQTANIADAMPISVAEIGSGNIVLLPCVLNHLIGFTDAVTADERQHLIEWIEGLRIAGNTVVVADLFHQPKTEQFWAPITAGLGAPVGRAEDNLDFTLEATEISKAYVTVGQASRRAGLGATATKIAVLRGNGSGWSWVT